VTAPERSPLERLADHDFHAEGPAGSLDTCLMHFRRPFTPAAVKWKVQTARQGYGIVVAYIDARLVIERLNLVVGGGWEDEYAARGQGVEECALTVLGVTRRDVGKGGGFEAEKAMRSDALKRAAVKFGIGASIYVLKAVELRATPEWEADGERLLIANKSRDGGKGKQVWSARMSPAAERWLAEMYGRWLESRGVKLFGPALDHGDEEGSVGIEAAEEQRVEEGAGEAEQETIAEPVVDEATAAAVASAEAVYEEIKALNPAQIPPGRHKTALRKAQGKGVDGVQAYATQLAGVLTTMKEARA
jgi:hypothetical protein